MQNQHYVESGSLNPWFKRDMNIDTLIIVIIIMKLNTNDDQKELW